MWLISEDRKRAVNTESKIELRVEKHTCGTGWLVIWGDFLFATCEKELDAIESLIGITILTMDTVVARVPTGITYKRCNILMTPDIDEYLVSSIKDIIQRRIKNNP